MITRENQRAWNLRDVSLTLNMTNGIFGGAVSTALLMCDSHVMSATKVAPPILPFLLLWDSTPSLAEGTGGGSLRASKASVAINRQRIPMILALHTLCLLRFARNDTMHTHTQQTTPTHSINTGRRAPHTIFSHANPSPLHFFCTPPI